MIKFLILVLVTALLITSCGNNPSAEAKLDSSTTAGVQTSILDSVGGKAPTPAPSSCGACGSCGKDCGPWDLVSFRDMIYGTRRLTMAFPYIMHIQTNRGRKADWGTVSFISPNTLITARHVLSHPATLSSLMIAAPSAAGDTWYTLYRGDFQLIYYNNPNEPFTDIALIKITNSEKLKALYHGNFALDTVSDPGIKPTDSAHLTGYPCDKGSFASGVPDTLMEKRTLIGDLHIAPSIIAYHMFTCTGDSGAPLWIEKNGQFYIVGVHHGGGEDAGLDESYNFSYPLTNDIIKWINSKS